MGALLLLMGLYPLIGGWAFLAFPIVFVAAVLLRRRTRRRRNDVYDRESPY